MATVLAPAAGPVRAAEEPAPSPLARAAAGLELRSIGPAVMGGRIADIEIDPRDRSVWYLAVGSGGVWKTENAGVTWRPIFDDQPSYSIGCVTLDPADPDVVWVGTGENVSGRHVGWGSGVYKSLDGGGSWQAMGLATSEHIGDIVVHPDDGDVVWVAAEGPLWAAGGERGLYKTTDGGESWRRVLTIDDDTGVTDIEIDPRDPDVLYAAAYQRRRHIWSFLAGGAGSGIYKSTDGGESWRRLARGLPEGDMGKIGLAVSPANPDVVYATIEADEKERGFYRSRDRGESWTKGDSYISNGTGPHYYQEIVASPHDVDRVYQMDVFLHTTSDGGESFEVLGTGREKHSDNHALWIDPADPKHLLAGTDAGLYESFDHGAKWRHFPNLPISQFYKLAVDDSEPFYNVLGGAQDLGTLFGPSRTTNVEGVRNQDWYVPMGADGYDSAFDPHEPDLMYVQWQGGRLHRYDRKSEEALDIRPQPLPGDPPERFNWDSPMAVSAHVPGRIYYGSQRLWRSDDRGDSWTAVSGDLTRDTNRYELEMMGRVWSVDALYDNGAMSLYSTITTISESPLVAELLYVGTDDGLVQVSENGGADWRRVELPGVPERSFLNDIEASLHDADTVYAVVDAHKFGDYRPLVFESNDRGRSWRSIAGDLPEREILWAFAQDHVDPDLLFVGAEYGVHVSRDGGKSWHKLAGAPTIPFRDITIQRRENDLVGATFGRGFYILDDYSPLRGLTDEALAAEAVLFPVRHAWWYVPYVPMQARGKPTLGSDDWTAPNPPFGATFTYHLKDTARTAKEERREAEKKLREKGEDAPFPGWERLAEEAQEEAPAVLLTVRDAEGRPVRRLAGPAKQGLHRVSWDLRRMPPDPVDLETPGFRPPWADDPQGPLVAPGTYTVELALLEAGEVRALGGPQPFEVRSALPSTLPALDYAEVAAFAARTAELLRKVSGAGEEIGRTEDRLRHVRAALMATAEAAPGLFARLDAIEASLAELRTRLLGDRIRGRLNESSLPSIRERVGSVAYGHWSTRQAPTATQRQNLELAASGFDEARADLRRLLEVELLALEKEMEAAGAPWTPGRAVD